MVLTEKEYVDAWAQVGDRSLRDVEPELAHTIAIHERDNPLVFCSPRAPMYQEKDEAKLLKPGRIARVLLDRHYKVLGLKTNKEKEERLRKEIIAKTDITGIHAHGTPKQKLGGTECSWMMYIGSSKIPAMLRFEELMKKGRWNDDAMVDAVYYAIIRS